MDFAVWELYIGTACAVAIFSDYILTRDFFRQFKGLKGYILICRGSFGLYNRKRKLKSVCEKIVHSGFCSLGLYIGTAPNEKSAVDNFSQTKKKNPSRGFFALRRVVITDLLPAVPLKLRSLNTTSDSNKSYAFTQPYGRVLLEILSSLRLRSYKPKTRLSTFTCRRLSGKLPL